MPEPLPDGVVFLEPALAARPATHVLVVGVGDYQWDQLEKLTSPTISARAVAEWFLDSFTCGERPLGSLALLLSETTGPSRFRGRDVPRATHANFNAALQAWLSRVESEQGNCALVYAVGHGQQEYMRSVFLLEDYRTKRGTATYGAMEVEQFANAMEHATPLHQLYFFDACRSQTDLGLAPTNTWGTPYIELTATDRTHHRPRNRFVAQSTGRSMVALGQKNSNSVFTTAFLEALQGAAADTDSGSWTVKPGRLIGIVSNIVRMHRAQGDEIQKPAYSATGDFTLHQPGDIKSTRVYVTTKDDALWPSCVMEVLENGVVKARRAAAAGDLPYLAIDLTEGAAIAISASVNGQVLPDFHAARTRPPVLFVELDAQAQPAIVNLTPRATKPRRAPKPTSAPRSRSPRHRAGDAPAPAERFGLQPSGRVPPASAERPPSPSSAPDQRGSLRVVARLDRVPASEHPSLGEVALVVGEVRRADRADDKPHSLRFRTTSGSGPEVASQPLRLESGIWEVRLELSSGQERRTELFIEPGTKRQVTFDFRNESPHEWLMAAFEMRAVRPRRESVEIDTYSDDFRSETSVVRQPAIAALLDGNLRDWTVDDAFKVNKSQETRGYVRLDLTPSKAKHGAYFMQHNFRSRVPLWLYLKHKRRRELCALPIIGRNSAQSDWQVHVVIDRLAKDNRSLSTTIVGNSPLTGALGFFNAGEFKNADKTFLAATAGVSIGDLIYFKALNPLAAVAGGFLALLRYGEGVPATYGRWLGNLCRLYPKIPDGAVLLAQHRLQSARKSADFDAARDLFLEAFRRGIPLYSLSVGWLVAGLQAFGKDEAVARCLGPARALAAMVDPTKAFTVLRLR